MSQPLFPPAAVVGRRYKTAAGAVVEFLGASTSTNPAYRGCYRILVIQTGRTIESLPVTQALFEIDEAAETSAAGVAHLVGKPRDILEPAIKGLSLADLEALAAADTRMWVQGAIFAAMSATPPAAVIAPAPVIADDAPPPFAIVPEPVIEIVRAEVIKAPIVIVPDVIASDEDETIADPGARSAAFMTGRAAFFDGIDPLANPFDGATDKIRYAAWVTGYAEAMALAQAEPQFVRVARVEPETPAPVEPPADAPEKVKAPRKPRALRAPVIEPAPIATVATEVEVDVAPAPLPPTDEEVRGWLGLALGMVERGTGSTEECDRLVQASAAARPELGLYLDRVTAELAQLVRPVEWDRIERLLRAAILTLAPVGTWATLGGYSIEVDGEAEIAREEADIARDEMAMREAERLEANAEVAASVAARVPPEAPPAPAYTATPTPEGGWDVRDPIATWLGARLDYTPTTRARFEALTGSVRAFAPAMVGLTVEDVPLLDAALAWEREHGDRDTVTRKLEEKLERLRTGRARHVEPRAPVAPPVAPTAPMETAPMLALSAAGKARVTRMQYALGVLSAALPGYLAAKEAEATCHALGLTITLAELAGE